MMWCETYELIRVNLCELRNVLRILPRRIWQYLCVNFSDDLRERVKIRDSETARDALVDEQLGLAGDEGERVEIQSHILDNSPATRQLSEGAMQTRW